MAHVLSVELLEDLEKRWRDQRAPIAERLQPGLTVDEMETAVAPLGLELPEEAKVWWGWHDGAACADLGVPVAFSYASLQHAVESAEFHRNLANEVMPEDPTWMWNWSWLPWSSDISGAALVIEARADMQVSPVSVHLKDDSADVPESAPSMGTLVSWWIELFDRKASVYDRASGHWQIDGARIPAHYDGRLT